VSLAFVARGSSTGDRILSRKSVVHRPCAESRTDDRLHSYADTLGEGNLLGAQMAIEDFGGQMNGRPIVLVKAAFRNSDIC
jgi:hypothetical protein